MTVMRVMNTSLNPSAACEDCSWAVSMSATSRSRAKSHAASTYHTVRVTTVTIDTYREMGA